MHRHAATLFLERLTLRIPFLRRLTLPLALLIAAWLYTIHRGERSTFHSHIEACSWEKWETWPAEAAPHHLVFVADPQLVDPHTYPGRPWPLSTLTERYTDLYMSRNFRLINAKLDPDSIVFLGDLFDGGREWSTSTARELKAYQRQQLEMIGVVGAGRAVWKRIAGLRGVVGTDKHQDEEFKEAMVDSLQPSKISRRSLASYTRALMSPHNRMISREDHNLDVHGEDLKAFVPGENGRWKSWDQRQWDKEFNRFGRIFSDQDQLYPTTERTLLPVFETSTLPVSVHNGGPNLSWHEYGTHGGKQRRVLTSLPGNHDLGFGDGVQLSVRDRFYSHFGASNQVNVLGNHTFVSLDTPSLSAFSQYVRDGAEPKSIQEAEHIWKPASNFLGHLESHTSRVVATELRDLYPDQHVKRGWPHVVTHPRDLGLQPSPAEVEESKHNSKPQLPVILLSHVPLYRDPETDCGPLRERGKAISISAGYQYQNVVTRPLSESIISNVSAAGDIAHIFSGDDHDYCEVVHHYDVEGSGGESNPALLRSIKEITVKSFSWAMGVRRPGFLLVSLWNPIDANGQTIGTPLPTIRTHLCLLPDQLSVFIDYALLLAFTLVVLLVRAGWVGSRAKNMPGEPDDSSVFLPPINPPRLRLNPEKPSNNTATIGRHRASSTSTSNTNTTNTGHLGVQRSYNARARSVSPAPGTGYGLPPTTQYPAPLIDKAGFYPHVHWEDPADGDSDEESRVGDEQDSQAKWKRRRRTRSWARRVVDEFVASVVVVGMPTMVYYLWLVRSG